MVAFRPAVNSELDYWNGGLLDMQGHFRTLTSDLVFKLLGGVEGVKVREEIRAFTPLASFLPSPPPAPPPYISEPHIVWEVINAKNYIKLVGSAF